MMPIQNEGITIVTTNPERMMLSNRLSRFNAARMPSGSAMMIVSVTVNSTTSSDTFRRDQIRSDTGTR